MDYNVNVSTTCTSTIDFRVAGYGGQIQLKNRSGTVLTTVNLPSTGNYQTYTTVSATATLPAEGSKPYECTQVKQDGTLTRGHLLLLQALQLPVI